jgi:hypothetical protein
MAATTCGCEMISVRGSKLEVLWRVSPKRSHAHGMTKNQLSVAGSRFSVWVCWAGTIGGHAHSPWVARLRRSLCHRNFWLKLTLTGRRKPVVSCRFSVLSLGVLGGYNWRACAFAVGCARAPLALSPKLLVKTHAHGTTKTSCQLPVLGSQFGCAGRVQLAGMRIRRGLRACPLRLSPELLVLTHTG